MLEVVRFGGGGLEKLLDDPSNAELTGSEWVRERGRGGTSGMLSVDCIGEVEGESSVSVSACRPLTSRRERAGPPLRILPRL